MNELGFGALMVRARRDVRPLIIAARENVEDPDVDCGERRFYLKRVIPIIGRALPGNPDCYRMLGVYTVAFGDASHFADCLRQVGFEVEETSYFMGCASGVRGTKPCRAVQDKV